MHFSSKGYGMQNYLKSQNKLNTVAPLSRLNYFFPRLNDLIFDFMNIRAQKNN